MKLILAFAVLFTSFCFSQEPKWRTITVQGLGEVRQLADKATFNYGVVGFGATLRKAVEEAKAKAEEINRKLLALGVPQGSIQTEDFASHENADKAFLSSKRDFTARISSSVTLEKLELVQEAILILSESQPERISRVVFSLNNPEEARNRAFQQAMQNARLRAQVLAKELGVTLGDPLLIETSGQTAVPYQVDGANIRGSRSEAYFVTVESQGVFISPKEITVRDYVKVVFSY